LSLGSAWEPLDIGSDALADRAVWFEQQLVSVGVASWGTSDIQSPEDSSMHTAILTSVLEDRELTSGLLCPSSWASALGLALAFSHVSNLRKAK
jgi:hypothetical protein